MVTKLPVPVILGAVALIATACGATVQLGSAPRAGISTSSGIVLSRPQLHGADAAERENARVSLNPASVKAGSAPVAPRTSAAPNPAGSAPAPLSQPLDRCTALVGDGNPAPRVPACAIE